MDLFKNLKSIPKQRSRWSLFTQSSEVLKKNLAAIPFIVRCDKTLTRIIVISSKACPQIWAFCSIHHFPFFPSFFKSSGRFHSLNFKGSLILMKLSVCVNSYIRLQKWDSGSLSRIPFLSFSKSKLIQSPFNEKSLILNQNLPLNKLLHCSSHPLRIHNCLLLFFLNCSNYKSEK